MIKGLLIDLDGTLVDTHPFLYEVFCRFLDRFDKAASKEDFEALIGPSLPEIVRLLKERYHLEPSLEELYEQYNLMLLSGGGVLIKGVKEFLGFAKSEGLRLAVVTSGPRAWAEKLLGSLGVRDSFEFIVTAGELERGKPAPDCYLEAIRQLGLPKESLLAVEDSSRGKESAERAGLKVLYPEWEKVTRVILEENYPWIYRGKALTLKEIGAPQLSLEDQEAIDKAWEREKERRPHIFNGRIFNYSRLEGETLYGFFTDYKTYLSRELIPNVRLAPIAVTALTTCRGKFLLGKRAPGVSYYANFWELTPSGGLSQLDPLKEIHQELLEEAGIQSSEIAHTELLGIFYDSHLNTCELAFHLELEDSAFERVQSNPSEVTELLWLEPDEINLEPLVPFARCLLKKI